MEQEVTRITQGAYTMLFREVDKEQAGVLLTVPREFARELSRLLFEQGITRDQAPRAVRRPALRHDPRAPRSAGAARSPARSRQSRRELRKARDAGTSRCGGRIERHRTASPGSGPWPIAARPSTPSSSRAGSRPNAVRGARLGPGAGLSGAGHPARARDPRGRVRRGAGRAPEPRPGPALRAAALAALAAALRLHRSHPVPGRLLPALLRPDAGRRGLWGRAARPGRSSPGRRAGAGRPGGSCDGRRRGLVR